MPNKNQQQGKRFEQNVAKFINKYAKYTGAKVVERKSHHFSDYDIELIGFPHFKVDCKSTTSYFTVKEMHKLLEICKKKYCKNGGIPVIIVGEKKGKLQIVTNEAKVLIKSKFGLTLIPLLDFVKYLDRLIVNGN